MKEVIKVVCEILVVVVLLFSLIMIVDYVEGNNHIFASTYTRDYPSSNPSVSSSDVSALKMLCKETIETNLNIEIEDSYLRVDSDYGLNYYVKKTDGHYSKYHISGTNDGYLLYSGDYEFPNKLYLKKGYYGYYLTTKN